MPARLLLALLLPALAFLHPLPGGLGALASLPFFFRVAALRVLLRRPFVPGTRVLAVLLMPALLALVLPGEFPALLRVPTALLFRRLLPATQARKAFEALAQPAGLFTLAGLAFG